ncbi:MAG: TetR/AcrR family transcriptional regulator [Pseudomonadota bacterium]
MPDKAKTPPPKTRKRSETPRLGRDDWLDCAYQAVTESGFDQVRVLTLADALNVTRGSFYWHFEDHAALIAALLERWRAGELATNATLQDAPLADPRADLERLLDAALAHSGTDLGNMRFELALRDLGRRDGAVASMLVEVDQKRMELFESKFERLTGDPKSAGDLAALFYLAIVGSNQALSRPANPPQLKQYLKGIISRYLIERQLPNS